jgi:formylglycine-generating enzyme
MIENPPEELKKKVRHLTEMKILHVWRWRPIGNEELVMQSGCAAVGTHSECGIAIGRFKEGRFDPLGYASSGWWLPSVHQDSDPKDLFVFGGDRDGGYRRKIAYTWGKVTVGEPERKFKTKRSKRRKPRKRK